MSNPSNTIDISSDSKEEYVIESETSSEASGWFGYFPPGAGSSSKKYTKETAKRMPATKPAKSLEFYSSSSEDDEGKDETYSIAKELPKALSIALETAISNMKQISSPIRPPMLPKPPSQVLGLPCPRMHSSFENKRKRAPRNKNGYVGKGKKPME